MPGPVPGGGPGEDGRPAAARCTATSDRGFVRGAACVRGQRITAVVSSAGGRGCVRSVSGAAEDLPQGADAAVQGLAWRSV